MNLCHLIDGLAGVYYLVMTLTISYIAKKIERKLAVSD